MPKSKARAADAALEAPFWERKPLHEMTPAEWESLCDGCGQCCLIKVEEEVTGDIYLTRLACRLLDTRTCRCRDYAKRHTRVPDCVTISPGNVRAIEWLPRSCAYRRLAEGRGLEWWHPLVSGDPETVHKAGVSVRGWARSEKGVRADAVARYIIGAPD
ncbi:MAG TPA: YcgN family cysteine cluster protein [Hyphomicrobium sp.]|jgi:uncharacterized protein|nr:YcgN family cysteine cluster protein [Hyphomicrobium sp.]